MEPSVGTSLPISSTASHWCRSQCNLTLCQTEIQDNSRDNYRITDLWKSFFQVSPKSSWFWTQVEVFSSLQDVTEVHSTKTSATMPYINYEVCIICLRLQTSFHFHGTLWLLFLVFWNTKDWYLLFFSPQFGTLVALLSGRISYMLQLKETLQTAGMSEYPAPCVTSQ